jgi:hypothetical protein
MEYIISDLITLLSNGTNVKTVVFADDIMIILQDPSLPAIVKELQNTLKMVDNWCEGNGLAIARDKTALMPMFTRNKELIKNHPIVRERKIKIVTQVKYLGVTLDSKLDWYPHTMYLENKVLSIRNNFVRCSTANWGLSFHNLLTIYNCAVLPVITYASESWCTSLSKQAKGKLQQIQRAYLIFFTNAYKTVSNEALSAISGTMPIDQAMQLYKDKRALSRGKPTNAVITALKYVETPNKKRDIHP